MNTVELEANDCSTTIHWVNRDELVEALELTQPAHFYKIADELEQLFSIKDYNPRKEPGHGDFLVAEDELTDEQLKQFLKELAEDVQKSRGVTS